MRGIRLRGILLILTLWFSAGVVKAQCPDIYDYLGNPSANPEWFACLGTDYTLNLQVDEAVANWSINWGDGSGIETGSGLAANGIITHLYTNTVNEFTITFTDLDDGCSVTGLLVMEEVSSPSIQLVAGSTVLACAPETVGFINSSTGVSNNTDFVWDFGDGTTQAYDHTNLGQTVNHTYQSGNVDCNTTVTLTAVNKCNVALNVFPEASLMDNITIWDLDEASIEVTPATVCSSSNTFTFTNNSELNCLAQGNIAQRYEYWNFGDYWGTGSDSIVDWTTFPPSPSYTLSFPSVGTFTVMMIDSNYCGADTAYTTVNVVDPPSAGILGTPATVCTGETINFTNTSDASANAFLINFDDGLGWNPLAPGAFTHVYNFAGSYDVGLVAYVNGSINTCSDTAFVTIDVVAGPSADFTIPSDASCGPFDVEFTNTTIGAISWIWDFGNTSTSTSPTPPTQSYNAIGDYPVSLIAEAANGCTSTKLDTISVYEPPTANFNFSATCNGDSVSFVNTSVSNVSDPIVQFDWDFDDTFTHSIENPYHTFSVAGIYDVELMVSTANCSDTITIPVDIADASTAGFTPSVTSGCTPLTVEFTNNSTSATSSNWNFGDGNFTTIVSPTHEFTNTGTTPLDVTVSLFTNNALGCADTTYQVITIYPLPQANFSMQTGAACAPVDVDFLNLSNGATNYEWTFEPGQTSTLISPSYFYTNLSMDAMTFSPELVAISEFGCTDTLTQNVTVYPEPSYSIDLTNFSGCSPLTVTMPSVADAVSYNWDFGNGNTSILPQPTQIFQNNSLDTLNFTVQLIASNSFGCSDTTSSIITVYPNANSQFVPNALFGCGPLEIEFTESSILADTYNWNFGDGTITTDAGDVSHTFENAGNTAVQYTTTLEVVSEHGCNSSSQVTLTVYPSVNASFTNVEPGCTPLSASFNNTSNGASSYYWSYGDGNVDIGTNPIHEYVNTGQINLEVEAYLVATSSFGCQDTAFQDITIYPAAVANFVLEDVQGCSPFNLGIENSITTGSTYLWNYGNGITSSNGDVMHDVLFTNATNDPVQFNILLETTSENGCTASTDQQITVYPELEADFNVVDEVCSGENVIFTNNSSGAVQYTWQFGDGESSNAINPIHEYTNETGVDQMTPVMLVAESIYGCRDNEFNLVTVHSAPIAAFEIDSTTVCYPLYIEIANNSEFAESYNWSYGDGTFSTTDELLHDYTYTNDGQTLLTNELELTATTEHGCTAVTSSEVQVIPRLTASFDDIEDACHPIPVNFNNTSEGALEYMWLLDVGVVTDEAEPTYTYVNYGLEEETYEVTLIVSSYFGCSDTLTHDFIVYPLPDADFELTPTLQTFPESTIDIIDNSSYGVADIQWDMGDGFLADTAVTTYTYDDYGVYFVTLTIDNGFCSDETTERVDIIPPSPIAIFEGEGADCVDVTVEFTNLSLFGESYVWNFGDGATSSDENPIHTYTTPGDYTVSLLVSGPGGNDISIQEDIVHAYPHAVADFSVNPPLSQTGDEVFFYNLSENASIYSWDFGNGLTSEESNPMVVYDEPGNYDVSLIVNNEFNCPDSLFMAGALEVEIGGYVDFPNAFTPNPNGGGEENYNPESLNNDIFFPVFKGVQEYNLQIYNRWGELLFETNDINKGWNGYYQGKLVPLGVYVWRADVTFTDNKQFVKSGDITLLR